MKARVIILIIFFLNSWVWNSCKEDEVDKPAINITELGYNNTRVGYVGGTFHVAADIISDGTIDNIQVGFHPAAGQLKSGAFSAAWSLDTTYTGSYADTTAASFDEWIYIPMTADTGTYSFQFKVTDREGGQTSVEEEIWLDYGK